MFMRKSFLLLIFLLFISSCSSNLSLVDNIHPVNISSDTKILLLPVINYTQSPNAGEKMQSILSAKLSKKGLKELEVYDGVNDEVFLSLKGSLLNYKKAVTLAKDKGYTYLISGSVEEWKYKASLTSDPVVALTIKITEVKTNDVIWTASSARTASGKTGISLLAHQLLDDMLISITVVE